MEFSPFNQPAPTLGNQYESDRVLREYLQRTLPPDVLKACEDELAEMGELAAGELHQLLLRDRLNEPVLTHWDPWGNRVDHIQLTPLWERAQVVAAERGLIATAYERKHGAYSRVLQQALVYLFAPSSDVYTCPLAMTDGAAQTLLKSGNQALIERALPRLTSRDPMTMWTSGQWMTESTGGSDVGQTETVAQKDGKTWRLYGRKWFTSATTSQMSLTLARPEGNADGGRGLAMFYVETRGENGELQGIEINRLKDKLGTRKVPTAELLLRGTPATPVKGLDNGIRNIASMLNITRMWNAVNAISFMRRTLALAADYATKRAAFGSKLSEKPLHVETLARCQASYEGAFCLTFFVVELIGKEETGEISEGEARLLRLLTPITKLITAKQTVAVISEGIESFGGAGYVEDTGLPYLLRDAQVLPIWEGTTNVLSLDTLRAIGREGGLEEFMALLTELGQSCTDQPLREAAETGSREAHRAIAWLRDAMAGSPAELEAGARDFALCLGYAVELALLCRQAQWSLAQGSHASKQSALLLAYRMPRFLPPTSSAEFNLG